MSQDQCKAIQYSNAALVGNASQRSIPWIWDGVIAAGAITLLSAPEKTGKTTLLSLLLDRRREGGMLLGRAVRPGRTILCSEEDSVLWRLRQPPLDFGAGLEYCRPLGGSPSRCKWRRYIEHLTDLLDDEDSNRWFDLLVIDTVMSFLPAAQNNPQRLLWALDELRWIANHSAGVLLLHQACAARSRSRTRGPLAAFADILIDMHVPVTGVGNNSPFAPLGRGVGGEGRSSRRRQFTGVGRYPGTLDFASAELNAEGTDYALMPDEAPAATVAPLLEALRQLLGQHAEPLTRQEILDHWPATEPPPRADSLWRSLTRGCELGIFTRSGEGKKAEAFRYGLVREQGAA